MDETETKKKYACNVCEDTHTVRLHLTGAGGPIFREVPCPECGPGVQLTSTNMELDNLRSSIKSLAILVAVALFLALGAWLANGKPDTWRNIAKEGDTP